MTHNRYCNTSRVSYTYPNSFHSQYGMSQFERQRGQGREMVKEVVGGGGGGGW